MREIPSNKNKWALLSTLIAMQFSSVAFADTKSITPQETLVIKRITEFWKDGDFSTAKRQIVDFLEKHPHTSLKDRLNAMLGDLYFQEGNYKQALATFELINDQEIKEKVFFNHLQTHFQMKEYETVSKKANEYLKKHKAESKEDLNLKIRYILAESLFQQALNENVSEKKTILLKMAKPHYKILTQTKYGDRVLLSLAETHRFLKEDQAAASIYELLAQKFSSHKERFLFQAALLQIKGDPKDALKNFEAVMELHGKREHLAAFNKLMLLNQMQNYGEYITFYEQVISKIPSEKTLALQFLYGKSFYAISNYEKAAINLEKYITSSHAQVKEFKSALFMLINCCSQLKDNVLLEKCIYLFKTNFPQDENLPRVLMMHAHICREKKDFGQSLTDFQTILKDYPNFKQNETVLFDSALLLNQSKKWGQSRETFNEFLSKYPNSTKRISAFRHLINCYLEEFKDPTASESPATKEAFTKDLEVALKEADVFSEKEKEQYGLVLVKCLYEIGKYELAIPVLNQFIADSAESPSLGDAHLLLALCQQKAKSDDSLFILHAEKAIALNPNILDKNILHLELYNAYLTLSLAESDVNQKQILLDKAASHLYLSNAWDQKTLKLENSLWLSNYYYKRAKEHKEANDYEKSNTLFRSLIGIKDKETYFNISQETLYLENEILKFADLLNMENNPKEQIALLEALTQNQQTHPEFSWKFQRKAILELGIAYENDKQLDRAMKTYRFLIKTSEEKASAATCNAQLNLVRLEFNLLKNDEKNLDNPKVITILQALKDLQIQKKLSSEPIHLEAALQYAEIRSSLAQSKTKDKLFFLNRIKEDFLSEKDPIALEYNQMRSQFPEKDKIFQSYMKYIDAEILKFQADLAKEENHLHTAKEIQTQAQTLLDGLLSQPESLKPYLVDRVNRSKLEIAQK